MTEGTGVAPLSGGSNQARVRDYNERLLLSLIQREGGLSRADIARRTGLSPQTVNIITRQLESDGLLLRGDPVRGKVGQPSIPLSLDPDGAFAFGLKIGRRTTELILLDFAGTVRHVRRLAYAYPEPDAILDFCTENVVGIAAFLTTNQRDRISGIGVATPFELWNWESQVGAPAGTMSTWRDFDMVEALSRRTGLPVSLCNDASAACAAELQYGRGAGYGSYAYFFVGFFVGGGMVLNQSLFTGRTGNAAAFGSMPVANGEGDSPRTLIDEASILILERMMAGQGIDPKTLWEDERSWTLLGTLLDDWLDRVATRLVIAAQTVCAVIDFEAVIIDGAFPPDVRDRLVTLVSTRLAAKPLPGLSPFRVDAGSLGSIARSLGGAGLQIRTRYLLQQDVLFKAATDRRGASVPAA